jgi:DNA-directed RNA polymerase specialized sigma24 family protein
MPANRKDAPDPESSAAELVALAVLVLRRLSSSQSELAREMHAVGFTTTRIASLLGTTPNTINQAIQKAKRKEHVADSKKGGAVSEPIDLNSAMIGLLRLAVAEREERHDPALSERKIEVLLHEAGLSHGQIAAVTGKQASAVRMAIARSAGKTKKKAATKSRSRQA